MSTTGVDFVPVAMPARESNGHGERAGGHMRSMAELREQRDLLRATAEAGGGAQRQHKLGKRTARERLELLLDEGSFVEIEPFRRHLGAGLRLASRGPYTDGVITGSGTVDGRRVFVYAQDFAILGGSLGAAHAAKIHKVMDLALATGSPIVGLNDSGGARIQEGVPALDGYGGIFRRHVEASGVIPQLSVILGPCAGGAAYSPALADFTFMVRGTAQMYLTGPDVVHAVTGERVSHEELGGADVHGGRSGVATFVYDDEETCLDEVRYVLSMLPCNNLDLPPRTPPSGAVTDVRPALARIVPAEPNKPYDMRRFPAGHRTGIRRHHPAWRETPVRLLRGHRAAYPGHRPQGVWRGVHRDGLALDRRGLLRRLADERDRGDGRGRRGQCVVPQGSGRGFRSGGAALAVDERVRERTRAPVLRG
jgi:acetyl-CoA carboxylase carboxyltransferase component